MCLAVDGVSCCLTLVDWSAFGDLYVCVCVCVCVNTAYHINHYFSLNLILILVFNSLIYLLIYLYTILV